MRPPAREKPPVLVREDQSDSNLDLDEGDDDDYDDYDDDDDVDNKEAATGKANANVNCWRSTFWPEREKLKSAKRS